MSRERTESASILSHLCLESLSSQTEKVYRRRRWWTVGPCLSTPHFILKVVEVVTTRDVNRVDRTRETMFESCRGRHLTLLISINIIASTLSLSLLITFPTFHQKKLPYEFRPDHQRHAYLQPLYSHLDDKSRLLKIGSVSGYWIELEQRNERKYTWSITVEIGRGRGM